MNDKPRVGDLLWLQLMKLATRMLLRRGWSQGELCIKVISFHADREAALDRLPVPGRVRQWLKYQFSRKDLNAR